MTMAGIFLSFSHRDSALAERIEAELEKLGHPTFNPSKDIAPGQDWREAMRAAIERTDMLLVLISSSHAASSSWMGYEVGMAEALGKPVVTLASDRLSKTDLPDDLISRQVLNFDPRSPERAAREVVERLAAA